MAKSYYMPADDKGKCDWLSNFAGKLGTYAPTVGVTAGEVTATQADYTFFNYVCDAKNKFGQHAQDWTAYKNTARDGGSLGAMPVAPTLAAAPPVVPADIFGRVALLAARIKKHPGYTEAMGQDLNIIGAEQAKMSLSSSKPVLKVTLQAGHPNVGWTKGNADALEIWVDRGAGFVFLAVDTVPDYPDTAPLPAPGASAVWKYKAIYRVNDAPIGQWSDISSISVSG